MIKHIVCYKLKDNSPEKREEAKTRFLSMKGKIDTIRDIEVGIDFLGSPRSYDMILQVTFDNQEALDLYQQNEYHCTYVKTYMHEVTEHSVSVDYEI